MKYIGKHYNLRKRRMPFNPSQGFLKQAVEDYILRGGTISRIVLDSSSSMGFVRKNGDMRDVDEFLQGK